MCPDTTVRELSKYTHDHLHRSHHWAGPLTWLEGLGWRVAHGPDVARLCAVADEAAALEAPVKVQAADAPELVDPINKTRAAVTGWPVSHFEIAEQQ